jgi:alcohol dehydrogenase class IV
LLPYVLEIQGPGLSASLKHDLQTVLGDNSPSARLKKLAEQMGAAVSLEAIGFAEADIPKAVSMLTVTNFPNPVTVDEKLIENLLRMAYDGALP